MFDIINRTTEIMEWVGLFREIDNAETEKPRFCIFVESNPFDNLYQTGIADGFSTTEKAAKRSVEYYDFSVVEDVKKTAIHIGEADELSRAGTWKTPRRGLKISALTVTAMFTRNGRRRSTSRSRLINRT